MTKIFMVMVIEHNRILSYYNLMSIQAYISSEKAAEIAPMI